MKTIRGKFDYFILTATIKNILRNNDRNFSFFRFASRSIVIRVTRIEIRDGRTQEASVLVPSRLKGGVLESKRVYTYRFRSRKNSPITRLHFTIRISPRVSNRSKKANVDVKPILWLFPLPRYSFSLKLDSLYQSKLILIWSNATTFISRKSKRDIFFLLYIKSSTYSGAGFLQRCVPVHAIGHWSPPTWNKQKYSVNIGVLAERSKSKVIDCSFQINISLSRVLQFKYPRFVISFLYYVSLSIYLIDIMSTKYQLIKKKIAD